MDGCTYGQMDKTLVGCCRKWRVEEGKRERKKMGEGEEEEGKEEDEEDEEDEERRKSRMRKKVGGTLN